MHHTASWPQSKRLELEFWLRKATHKGYNRVVKKGFMKGKMYTYDDGD